MSGQISPRGGPGRGALSPDRASAIQQEPAGGGAFPVYPDGGHSQAGAAAERGGAAAEELPELIAAVRECANLRLTGLMTMPPWSEDAELSRPYFRRLRELAERHGLAQISMGMSHDLEAAIEEGATRVRVGTALFGRRKKG